MKKIKKMFKTLRLSNGLPYKKISTTEFVGNILELNKLPSVIIKKEEISASTMEPPPGAKIFLPNDYKINFLESVSRSLVALGGVAPPDSKYRGPKLKTD